MDRLGNKEARRRIVVVRRLTDQEKAGSTAAIWACRESGRSYGEEYHKTDYRGTKPRGRSQTGWMKSMKRMLYARRMPLKLESDCA